MSIQKKNLLNFLKGKVTNKNINPLELTKQDKKLVLNSGGESNGNSNNVNSQVVYGIGIDEVFCTNAERALHYRRYFNLEDVNKQQEQLLICSCIEQIIPIMRGITASGHDGSTYFKADFGIRGYSYIFAFCDATYLINKFLLLCKASIKPNTILNYSIKDYNDEYNRIVDIVKSDNTINQTRSLARALSRLGEIIYNSVIFSEAPLLKPYIDLYNWGSINYNEDYDTDIISLIVGSAGSDYYKSLFYNHQYSISSLMSMF